MRPASRLFVIGALLSSCAVATTAACWYEVPDVVTPDAATDTFAPDVIVDTGIDEPVDDGGCNLTAPFGAPALLVTDPAYQAYDKRAPRLSPDELTVYFASGLPNGVYQLYEATRSTWSVPFSTVVGNVPGLVNGSDGSDESISVAPDGLLALIGSTRYEDDNPGMSQVWSTARASSSSPFSAPMWSGTSFGSHVGDWDPYIVGEDAGLYYFYYASLCASCPPPNNLDIHYASFDGGDGGYVGLPSPSNLNSGVAADRAPVLTPDQLRIYFSSDRTLDGGVSAGNEAIWTSYRPNATAAWVTPTPVSELADAGALPRPAWVSPNGCRLYFDAKVGTGTYETFVATRGH